MSLLNPDPSPQFGTAEYAGQSDRCKQCSQPIMGSYYRAGAKIVCPSCAELLKREGPQDGDAAFMRGLVVGVGGAILGLILYSGFTIITGIELGYVSLAVGYIVAKAILIGSQGRGGRKYQIAAVVLTYIAVSGSAVPMFLSYAAKSNKILPLSFLLKWGVASPFLWLTINPFNGLIGLVILAAGIRIAWKMTAGSADSGIYGPFENSKSASA